MQTHTIRNKGKPTPIFTLTPAFFARVQECYPEAVTLALGSMVKQYQTLTGKKIVLDHEQQLALMKMCGADASGTWVSRYSRLKGRPFRLLRTFESGFLSESLALDEALELAQEFFVLLEKVYGAELDAAEKAGLSGISC